MDSEKLGTEYAPCQSTCDGPYATLVDDATIWPRGLFGNPLLILLGSRSTARCEQDVVANVGYEFAEVMVVQIWTEVMGQTSVQVFHIAPSTGDSHGRSVEAQCNSPSDPELRAQHATSMFVHYL
eukprot:gb/GECG01007930.1/.p1 GENE.gb/GECG01007930.1/~~gb/GECG01007930.1/.p1  ORF type:complete len:125 (+),score=8.84 gb/GECG01007930.1/:1-375(+)